MCLLLAAGITLLFYPPAWHAVVRSWLRWEAARWGLQLDIGAVDGTPLDATVLHGVRLRSATAAAESPVATDLQIGRAEWILSPSLPLFGRAKSSWLDRLVLEDVRGNLSLDALHARQLAAEKSSSSPADWPRERANRFSSALAAHLTPLNFEIVVPRDADLTLHRARAALRLRGARLSGYKDAPGVFLAREIEARAPGGLDNVFHDWRATTQWSGTRFTLNRLALAPGIEVVTAALDGSQLRRKLLNGDLTLRALGGTLRSQVKAFLPRPRGPHPGRWQLEVAGSLESVAVRPLTELLGLAGPTGGVVRAGVFSFNGDPADLSSAAASARFEVTDFQWGARRWQRLLLAATALHRRITVHELDLVQRRNRLVLNGEGPLPLPLPPSAAAAAEAKLAAVPKPADAKTDAVAARFQLPPWLDNFSCNVDARIDDLEDFAHLLWPGFGLPALTGRMNAQGTLTGRERALDGYLKIEAGPLRVSRAPLDRLRATMTFRGDELQITNLEAVRAADSLLGKGAVGLAGSGRYTVEGRLNVRDLAPYGAAFAGYGFPEPPTGALTLEWSGDGAPGAHSGAFRGKLGGFQARGGRVALPRRIDLEADGTYSPESVSFRQLALRDLGDAPAAPAPAGRRPNPAPTPPATSPAPAAAAPALRFEGVSLPLTPDRDLGGLFRGEGAFSGRVLLADFALDFLPPVLPDVLREAGGRLSGWLDLAGTPRAPRLNGQLTLRRGRFRWTEGRVAAWLDADNALADARLDGPNNTLHLDKLSIERPAGGAVTITGQLGWPDTGSPPALDLAIGARNVALLDNADIRARADFDVTAIGPADTARVVGSVLLRDARFYHQFWLEPISDDASLSLLPLSPNPATITAGAGASLLARLLPLASLSSGPLARCEFDLALGVDAPVPMEAANAVRGVLRPELALTGTGANPQLVGKLAFERATRAGGGAGATAALPPRSSQSLPLDEGVIYFDPAGLAASTIWFRGIAQPRLVTAPANARLPVSGDSIFAPIDYISLRVPAGTENELTGAWDITWTPPLARTGEEFALNAATVTPSPLFPEPVPAGQRIQVFRLRIF